MRGVIVKRLGDINAPEYEGGVLWNRSPTSKSGDYVVEYTLGPENGGPLIVYEVSVQSDLAEEYDWIDWGKVADSTGRDMDDLIAEAGSPDFFERALALLDAAGYYGWFEFDQYPREVGLGELDREWREGERRRARRNPIRGRRPPGRRRPASRSRTRRPPARRGGRRARRNPIIKDPELSSIKKDLRLDPHLWVIYKSSGPSTGYGVSIGDPYKPTSTIVRLFPNAAALREWVRHDMEGAVSQDHIIDTTRLKLVPEYYTYQYVELCGPRR
jgi:hypothetical protein